MKTEIFKTFDFSDFWDDSEYALREYVSQAPSDELIASVEQELGFKLPASYIELMKLHNGGVPLNTCFPTSESTSWAENHIAITGIMGIGREKTYSLCGQFGSPFMIDEWGYPDTGVYICDCPSAGHDMVMLDYSKCGRDGEPEVVHVDQESDYKKTFLAKDFESFIRGLVNDSIYDNSEQELADTLETFKTGRFSDTLQRYFEKDEAVNFDTVLRNLFTELTNEKGYFALHADPLSYLAYDIQFYLLSLNEKVSSKKAFVKAYPPMVAMGNNEISTGGYADFFGEWFDVRVKNKQITKGLFGGFEFTADYKEQLFAEVKRYE
jgi:hypothetical protein